MSLQPWMRAPACKFLICLGVLLVGLQYMFSGTFHTYRHETLFYIHGGAHPSHSLSWHNAMRNNATNSSTAALLLMNLTANTAVSTAETLILHSIADNLNITNKNGSEFKNLTTSQLSLCPLVPTDLRGPVGISDVAHTMDQLELLFDNLEPGGHYTPQSCKARSRVALIIPYRDRPSQLNAFLYHMHPFLQKQQLEYGIIIVEQAGYGPFNRAMLMNIGFVEAQKLHEYDCFIFHDVDLLPEDDRNLYTCPEQPRHMSVAVSTLKYKLPYKDIFGGVSALTLDQFKTVNGFSNKFWGWGGEDDDMANRLKYHDYHISRYPANIARYKMLPHRRQPANPKRHEFLYNGNKRFNTDGLNNLQYQRQELKLNKLYTWVLVEISESR
ncbi:beta-1,4-N-acetylgalactosaminyltransferase bre-4-like isoform X2 [Thrips palmi]|nr:beta-1,4-N-acetylgalactosaminyltransferase bre-4-like isoform X2 [Thrips palmi]XP_034254753.1 beta-1,4-N-acetylgalactosaminyltransferase bre-4-like isoform X2 [Thrips palmi]